MRTFYPELRAHLLSLARSVGTQKSVEPVGELKLRGRPVAAYNVLAAVSYLTEHNVRFLALGVKKI